MFDWMLPETHAIAILKKDHDTVKGLFEEFQKAETQARRTKLVDQALTELKIHAILEEEIFYPTVRAHVGRDIMNEADEEHHVAKVLIAELDTIDAKNDHRDAKFTVLAESVRHHIREEETEMLVQVRNEGSFIPEDEREKVFQRFYRGPDTAGRIAGTGIGLSVVKRITEAHQGRTWVKSDPEGGTTFVLSLPKR